MRVDGHALIKALRQLPSQMQKSTLASGSRAGAKVLAERARALAPTDTGELRRQITVGTGRAKRGSARHAVYFKGERYRVAHLLEFGTAHQPAQPFIRPAIQQAAEEAIQAAALAVGKNFAMNAEKVAGAGGRAHVLRGLKADARSRAFRSRR